MNRKLCSISQFRFFNQDKWMLEEEIPDMDLFFSQIWMSFFVNDLENSVGRNYKKVLALFSSPYSMKWFYGEKDCEELTKHIFDKVKENPSFGQKINSEIVKRSDKMESHARKVRALNLKKLSANQLWKELETHYRLHTFLYEFGWLSNATDMFFPYFTTYLKDLLRLHLSSEEKVNTCFVVLTNPSTKTPVIIESEELFNIGIKIQNNSFHCRLFSGEKSIEAIMRYTKPEIALLIQKHWKKYCSILFLYHGSPATIEHFYEQLVELIKSGENLTFKKKNLLNGLRVARFEKKETIKKLRFSAHEKELFEIFGGFMITKWYRRYAQIRSLCFLAPLFKELSRRTALSLVELRTMLPSELKTLILKGKPPADLKERSNGFAYYAEKGREAIFTRIQFRRLRKKIEVIKVKKGLKELHGQTASLGKAKGRVKIITSHSDIKKMKKGDILVAIATNPDVVPAMKKAAAIVTDQGGVTCHAAIVSRELGVPCVIGTKIASKWLKDNDLVEVNATKGTVKKLSRNKNNS